jgi:flagellar basal-body rod protein FlgF
LSRAILFRGGAERQELLGKLCPRRPGGATVAENSTARRTLPLGTEDASPPAKTVSQGKHPIMDSPSSVALSGQLARDRQMDVLANNIANLSTTAFKGEQVLFAELLSNASGAPVRYVQDAGTVRDWSQGPLTRTGNSLDVALQGSGFLEVQTTQGIRYTRDGRMKLDSQGQLVTLDGNPVLGDSQSPIALPQGTTSITIGEDGSLTTPTGTAGKLTVVTFDKLQAVAAESNGLYTTEEAPNSAPDTKVVQGMLEESNVQPILEMTRLMATSRAVGMAKSFQDNESDRHKTAIDRLAKTV